MKKIMPSAVPDTPSTALIVICTSILFERKRVGISASSSIGNISDTTCTLFLKDVESPPSIVDFSKSTTSGTKAADVEGADVEGADVECADVEGAEVAATDVVGADVEDSDVKGADMKFPEVKVAVWDSLTSVLLFEGKNILMSEDIEPPSSSLELKSIYDKDRNVNDTVKLLNFKKVSKVRSYEIMLRQII